MSTITVEVTENMTLPELMDKLPKTHTAEVQYCYMKARELRAKVALGEYTAEGSSKSKHDTITELLTIFFGSRT